MRSSTCGQMDVRLSSPAAGPLTSPVCWPSSARSSTGTTTSSSTVFALGGWTTSTSCAPPRKRATSSTGRTVAERPTRWAGRANRSSSRSRDSARCAPRLVPATAWTSSTITVSTPRSDSRACEVRMRKSDSGVVMRMSGGVRASRRRSSAGVSPDRTPTRMSGSGRPSRVAACRMPTRGARRLRSTSTARAFIGETYSTRHRRAESVGSASEASRSIDQRKAARVLPDPVGATTSALRPAPIASHAPVWAAVGAWNDASNHACVAGLNRPAPEGGVERDRLTRSSSPAPPTAPPPVPPLSHPSGC